MSPVITIKDVAREAGCGIATVSRVLNKSGAASAETRERVLDAATRLGFSFNELGRSLQSQRTRTIGCLVPSLVNPVFAEAVQDLQKEALGAGFQVLLACSNYDPALEADALRMLLAKRVDGIVLTLSSSAGNPALEHLRGQGLPLCMLYNSPVEGVPSAYVDNRRAAAQVAAEFARLGHRRVAFLALRFGASDRSHERYEGFRDGCLAAGLEAPELIEVDEAIRFEDVKLAQRLKGPGALTGVFASNDYLALSVIGALHDLGLSVPGDVSVVGFDGIDMGLAIRPRLATVVTDAREMGRSAAQTLIGMIDAQGAATDQPQNSQKSPQKTPSPELPGMAFSFRRAESLGPARGGGTDDGQAATSPPS
ncbi:MAG: LacI family DNA-binding transcriptional regulator [Roseovarius sp.]